MTPAMTAADLIRTYRPERGLCEAKAACAEIALGEEKLWLAKGDNRWRAIMCLQGAIWITQDRDVQDHVITAGEMFLISRPGMVIVQALTAARMRITPCLAPAAACRTAGFQATILR